METGNQFSAFDASLVPLDGSNLIEASAGTGKTYSIALLVLRLVMERQYGIREILMVTFTKAAVAELEERIRLFVRNAYRVSNNEPIGDATITALVQTAVSQHGQDKVKDLLRDAIVYLDETSVLTIHSFCQQTLNEFAFETNQLFGAELLQDTSLLIESEVNKFWRKHITSIPVALLSMIDENLARKDIVSIVKTHLDGKKYQQYDPGTNMLLDDAFYNERLSVLSAITADYDNLYEAILQRIADNREKLRTACAGNGYAKKALLHLVDDSAAFLESVISRKDKAYVIKLFSDLLDDYKVCEDLAAERAALIEDCLDQIYYVAITEAAAGVKKYKLQNNLLSFDDLVSNLYAALVLKENPTLEFALRKKYKAVFIDEFQDTDRMQYEIFKQAFGKDTVLFYIGDPKQSIYAWRKADINTYFKAYDDADVCYGMNHNYRSSVRYIQAMNLFFQPAPGFDTFHFPQDGQAISYIPVASPPDNNKGELFKEMVAAVPITIIAQPNKDAVAEAVAAQVADLLSDGKYTIVKNHVAKKLMPSDIGILVRSNNEGRTVKNSLAKIGIPAVTIGDAKVLQSPEAVIVLYMLEAMLEINRSNINRALLSPLTGYTTAHILQLDDEMAIGFFRQYKLDWEEDGIYTALGRFVADFGVQHVLLHKNPENGERIITNFYQLVELLYKIQTTKKLSPQELRDWLKRGIESNDGAGDEYEQRMESDEESVKIVTIHKSKGLEYKIVLAPFLDFVERKKEKFCNYRDIHGDYVNVKKDQLSDEMLALYRQQSEQENRRLLYVALTRAVYKCFIFKNNASRNSTLAFFTDALQAADAKLVAWAETPILPGGYYYKPSNQLPVIQANEAVRFDLLQKNWTRMSYTMLAAEAEKSIKYSSATHAGEYDHFIFNLLARGNKTGNMLHYIFEHLHFNNSEQWPTVIEKGIKRFAPLHLQEYQEGLSEMLTHVLNAVVQSGSFTFNLSSVAYDQRIHEFEFDFPVKLFDPSMLSALNELNDSIRVRNRGSLEGIMNGKLDMLFRHQEKYFVLDWKSTYLGGRLEDYSAAALERAMDENNYHLQYLIYTLATKKYLESRLPGFDYEQDFGGVLYFFVRGMREHSTNGIFTYKPSLSQVMTLDKLLSPELESLEIF